MDPNRKNLDLHYLSKKLLKQFSKRQKQTTCVVIGALKVNASRVKSGNFGHRVNSDKHLQTVKIQMRRLLMSRLIRIFIVCLVNLFFIPIFEI